MPVQATVDAFFVKLKYLLPVKLPKEIVIYNGRLSCLQLTLQLSLVIGLFILYYTSHQYMVERVPQFIPNGWQSEIPDADYSSKINEEKATDVCQYGNNAKQGNFAYRTGSSGGEFDYKEYKCITLPRSERFKKVGNTIVYFPTFFRETKTETGYTSSDCDLLKASCYTADGSVPPTSTYGNGTVYNTYPTKTPDCLPTVNKPGATCYSDIGGSSCTCKRNGNYLVAGATAQKLVLNHKYDTAHPDSGKSYFGRSSWTEAQADQKGDEVLPITSIVESFNSNTGEYEEFQCPKSKPGTSGCRFKPGENVKLDLEEWTAAAGASFANIESLNTGASDLNENASPNYPNPMLRLTGMEVTVQVNYYMAKFLRTRYSDVDNAVALVQIKGQPDWASTQESQYGALRYAENNSQNSEERYRYYYGIRFVFKQGTSGRFGWPTVAGFVAIVAVFSVYLRMLVNLIKIIAIYALGDTSRSYMRAQADTFNVDRDAQQVSPALILIAAAAFKSLCRNVENDDGVRVVDGKQYLTIQALNRVFHHVFSELLDDTGIRLMTRNVYNSIAYDEKFGNEKVVGSGEAAERLRQSEKVEVVPGIDMDSFVKAACRNQTLDLPAMANLFDLSDQKGCIERAFGETVHVIDDDDPRAQDPLAKIDKNIELEKERKRIVILLRLWESGLNLVFPIFQIIIPHLPANAADSMIIKGKLKMSTLPANAADSMIIKGKVNSGDDADPQQVLLEMTDVGDQGEGK